ncbi:hypothetical protein EV681_3465 [Advenella incenata]|uniref:Uncharacterized protein n=1 Tax=Advenella incenata TaxID=267800 RepID=A0A4Q7VD65_9BURK|nr:hypothetical protein EV681_3465 [Advenella incenata]
MLRYISLNAKNRLPLCCLKRNTNLSLADTSQHASGKGSITVAVDATVCLHPRKGRNRRIANRGARWVIANNEFAHTGLLMCPSA